MFFTKMHGLGNDFIVVESEQLKDVADLPIFAVRACDRNRGIGADGVLIVGRSKSGNVSMTLYNNDGSRAQMCGNGIRCIALYAHKKGLVAGNKFSIDTDAGEKQITLFDENMVEVDMGIPVFKASQIPVLSDSDEFIEKKIEVAGRTFTATCVSMGNPHCVIFTDEMEKSEVIKLGALLERAEIFPERCNIEFAHKLDESHFEVKVWERGAGPTQACGTGACAVFSAALKTGRCKNSVEVKLIGGRLTISLSPDERILMRGSAEFVFQGDYAIKEIG